MANARIIKTDPALSKIENEIAARESEILTLENQLREIRRIHAAEIAKLRSEALPKRIFQNVENRIDTPEVEAWIRVEMYNSESNHHYYKINAQNRRMTNQDGYNLLDIAILNNNEKVIQLCIESGYTVNKAVAESLEKLRLNPYLISLIADAQYTFPDNSTIRQLRKLGTYRRLNLLGGVLKNLASPDIDPQAIPYLFDLIQQYIEHDPRCFEKIETHRMESILTEGSATVVLEFLKRSIIDTSWKATKKISENCSPMCSEFYASWSRKRSDYPEVEIHFWQCIKKRDYDIDFDDDLLFNPLVPLTQYDMFMIASIVLFSSDVSDEDAVLYIEKIKPRIDWDTFYEAAKKQQWPDNVRSQHLFSGTGIVIGKPNSPANKVEADMLSEDNPRDVTEAFMSQSSAAASQRGRFYQPASAAAVEPIEAASLRM